MTSSLRGFQALTKPQAPRILISCKLRTRNYRDLIFQSAIGIVSGWLASTIFLPASAATFINNSGVQFEQDTILESSFVESHGAYQSTFGVINLDTQEKTPLLTEIRAADAMDTIFRPSSKVDDLGRPLDFLGTPGNAVPQSASNFTFKSGNRYVFYLESSFNGRPVGVLYSNDELNPNRNRQVQFRGQAEDLCAGGMTIAWDDTGSRLVRSRPQQDEDFDDFVVNLKRSACPIGGGERPAVGSDLPPPPAAAVTSSGGVSPAWALAALPLGLFALGGDDDDGSTVVSSIPPSTNPPIGSTPPSSNPPVVIPPFVPPPPDNPPTTPIPEPMTILGSSAAIGMAGLIQRRRKQKEKQKSKSKSGK